MLHDPRGVHRCVEDQLTLSFPLWKVDVHPAMFLEHLWHCRLEIVRHRRA